MKLSEEMKEIRKLIEYKMIDAKLLPASSINYNIGYDEALLYLLPKVELLEKENEQLKNNSNTNSQ